MDVSADDLATAIDRTVSNGLYYRNPIRDGMAPIRRSKVAA
jgi:hypothetical protein